MKPASRIWRVALLRDLLESPNPVDDSQRPPRSAALQVGEIYILNHRTREIISLVPGSSSWCQAPLPHAYPSVFPSSCVAPASHHLAALRNFPPPHSDPIRMPRIASTATPHTARSQSKMSQSGLSLLEMTAALAFVSVLLGISVPTIATFSGRTYLRGETVAARLFLERAYGYALAFRQTTNVTIENTSLITRTESGSILERLSLRRNVRLRPESVRDNRIIFYPSITATPATLRLTRGALQCSIIISLRGRTRITC